MDVRGDIRDVVDYYLKLKDVENNLRIVVFLEGQAYNLLRKCDKDMLRIFNVPLEQAPMYSGYINADKARKDIENPLLPITDYRMREFGQVAKMHFAVLKLDEVQENQIQKSKIFKELKSMSDFENVVKNYSFKHEFNSLCRIYEYNKIDFKTVDKKDKRFLFSEHRAYVKPLIYKDIAKNNFKIPELVFLNVADMESLKSEYGLNSYIDLVLKNPVNKYKVPEKIIEDLKSFFIDLEMTELNQQKLVKALMKTKSVASKDLNGNTTKLAAKLDDKYFDLLLKDFPTLRNQVEEVTFSNELNKKLEKQPQFFCFKWSIDILNFPELNKSVQELLHANRATIANLCAKVSDVKIENSNNVGKGVEYFIFDITENPSFNLNEFKENFSLLIKNYLENEPFRTAFIDAKKSNASNELAFELLNAEKNKTAMKKDLEQNNNTIKSQNMVKLTKF